MSKSMRSIKETFQEIGIEIFLYTHLVVIESPTGVETVKGYKIVLGLIGKYTAIDGVTKKVRLNDLIMY